MMKKSQRLLDSRTIDDPVEGLRHLCLARCFSGIVGFGRCFREVDQNGKKTLNLDEFTNAMHSTGFRLPQGAVETLYDRFKEQEGINITHLLVSIRVGLRFCIEMFSKKIFFLAVHVNFT
jgi:hypothetical protein